MRSNPITMMPPIPWLEGLLDYFDAQLSPGSEERRAIGHGVGRQIIGLYVIEMILKYAVHQERLSYSRKHNLLELFGVLSASKRTAVELKYRQILLHGVAETWDVFETVNSFLEYLGNNPITQSRYFWDHDHFRGRSIIFTSADLRHLMHALFIALHDYPEGYEYEVRFDTKFTSLEQSFQEEDERIFNEPRPPDGPRKDKAITPVIFWLEGLLAYFFAVCPREADDSRHFGFQVGQRIIGLYLVEMILKYALDDIGRDFTRTHNLRALFNRLPPSKRRAAQNEFARLSQERFSLADGDKIDLERNLASLGNDPITDLRYFWESTRAPIPLSPGPLRPIIFALLTAFHGYPPQ